MKVDDDIYLFVLQNISGLFVLSGRQSFSDYFHSSEEDINQFLSERNARISEGSHDASPVGVISIDRCFYEI